MNTEKQKEITFACFTLLFFFLSRAIIRSTMAQQVKCSNQAWQPKYDPRESPCYQRTTADCRTYTCIRWFRHPQVYTNTQKISDNKIKSYRKVLYHCLLNQGIQHNASKAVATFTTFQQRNLGFAHFFLLNNPTNSRDAEPVEFSLTFLHFFFSL